jgi:hypothetical protein
MGLSCRPYALPDCPMTLLLPAHAALLGEVRGLIDQAQQHVAQAANSALTLLYWQVGLRIQREVLRGQRAEYGEQIMSTLSAQLVAEYGATSRATRSSQRQHSRSAILRSHQSVCGAIHKTPIPTFPRPFGLLRSPLWGKGGVGGL